VASRYHKRYNEDAVDSMASEPERQAANSGTPLDQALARSRALKRLPAPRDRRRIRERAGISQADVASALDVSRIAVLRWERGDRTPRGATLVAYVKLLDRLTAETLMAPA
jgi:DNA-binding transcriptional regulator YiaG